MNRFDLDTAKRWTDETMEVGDSIILKNRKDADTVAYKMKRDGKQAKIQKISNHSFSVLRTK